MKRIGIIDVGSNSARLVIMEISSQKGSHLVYNQKDPLRLSPFPRVATISRIFCLNCSRMLLPPFLAFLFISALFPNL